MSNLTEQEKKIVMSGHKGSRLDVSTGRPLEQSGAEVNKVFPKGLESKYLNYRPYGLCVCSCRKTLEE